MFCTRCGARIDDDASFCTSCGSPVQDAFAPEEPEPQVAYEAVPAGQTVPFTTPQGQDATFVSPGPQQAPAYQQPYQQPPTKKSYKGVLIAVLAIVAAAAVAAALYFSGVFDRDHTSTTSTATTTQAQVTNNETAPQQTETTQTESTSQSHIMQSTGSETSSSAAAPSQTSTSQTSQSSQTQSVNGDLGPGTYFTGNTAYMNERFGYSILIPGGFTCESLSANGDGGVFSNDAGVTITTYGLNNTGSSLQSRYDDMVSTYSPEYKTLLEDKSAFVVSWVAGGREYYHMEYVGSGSIDVFEVEYAAGDSRGDAVVEQIQPTFTAGNISSSF